MRSEDKKEFAGIMVAMGENFNAKITKEGLKILTRNLQGTGCRLGLLLC